MNDRGESSTSRADKLVERLPGLMNNRLDETRQEQGLADGSITPARPSVPSLFDIASHGLTSDEIRQQERTNQSINARRGF